jgi:hypothetical protein
MQKTAVFIRYCIFVIFFTFRDLLAFVFIPVIKREVEIFYNDIWNTHRIRQQKDALMPKGVPDHMFNFPTVYGAEDHGKMSCSCVARLIISGGWVGVGDIHKFVFCIINFC